MSSKACELVSHPGLLRQANGSCKSDFGFCHFVRGLEEIGRLWRVPQKALKGATRGNSLLPVGQARGTLTLAELHTHGVLTARALPGQSPTKEPPHFKHGHHWLSRVSVLPSSEPHPALLQAQKLSQPPHPMLKLFLTKHEPVRIPDQVQLLAPTIPQGVVFLNTLSRRNSHHTHRHNRVSKPGINGLMLIAQPALGTSASTSYSYRITLCRWQYLSGNRCQQNRVSSGIIICLIS